MRRQYAEIAYAREINQLHEKQERISHITEYEDEPFETTTTTEYGNSITEGMRLRPSSEPVVTGYDYYSRDEVVSRYAEKFLVPDRTFTAILPDGTKEQFTIPTLRKYLYNSPEVLEFMGNPDEPAPNPTERSNEDAPKRTRKKPATLHNAKRR